MMISKRLSGSNLEPKRMERGPEALRIAEAAERDGSPARESSNVFSTYVSPAERLNARPEDGRVRIKVPEPLGNSLEAHLGIATGHDKYACSTKGFKRLA